MINILNKKITTIMLCITLCITLIIPNKTYADTNNLFSVSDTEFKRICSALTYSIIDKGSESLPMYQKYFTDDAFKSFLIVANSNSFNGSAVESQIDTVHIDNSDTKDTVVMYNIKIKPYNKNINVLMMLEMHINRDGLIYGFNVWAY